jgi:alpha-L-arabinofuranosidase
MKNYIKYTILILAVVFISCSNDEVQEQGGETPPVLTETAYDILVDVNETQGEVSKLLMGFNSIYCFEKDNMWQNGTGQIPTMLERFNTGIIRYPGGAVVNRYHWNNLNGEGWKDNWNPNYDTSSDQLESEFMDIDEYMTNITAIGAEPMVGINMGSGMKYNRVQDGIDEAVALVQHCKDKGYNVTYFYLDNETYHNGANYKMTPTEYANQINLYVPALKAVNPNIETVVNWERNITSKTGGLETIVSKAGDNIDIIEVHWYWSWEDATFDHWISSFPMGTKNQWYNGLSYESEILAFQPLMNSLGHGDIKLASNEWNLAPGPSETETPSKFESALMVSEIFSQYIDANLFMANFWGVHWPTATGNTVNRLVLDPSKNYSENAMATVFEMFGAAMGGTKVKCASLINGVYDIAVLDEVTNELIIYLINKKQSDESLSTGIDLKNYSVGSVKATSFVNDTNGNGKLIELSTTVENGNRLIIDLPKNSLTKIVVKK